jgi:membrane-associated protease RseP (regulator of RpoE activity)
MAALATGGWLLVVLAASTALPFVLSARGDLPDWLSVDGPLLTLRWEGKRATLARVTTPSRVWRALWTAGALVALVLATLGLVALLAAALATILEPALGEFTSPRSVVFVPGLDGFLPLSVAPALVVALVVALGGHELGHTLACSTDDIDVSAVGAVLLGALPVGAFIEHDAESLDRASPASRARMLAAGVTSNFLVALLAIALLAGPVAASLAPAAGVPVGAVVEGGPADQANVEPGDVLVRVEGHPVDSREALDEALAGHDRIVAVQLDDGNTIDVRRSLLVAKVAPDAPADLDPNTRILAVDGEEVHTISGFRDAVGDTPTARISTPEDTIEIPIGVGVSSVARSGALAAAGAPIDQPITILSIDGTRTLDPEQLAEVLEAHEPGDEVTVRAYVDGFVQTYAVEIRAGVEGNPRLGVFYQSGTSGIVLSDFGIETYPSEQYLEAFGLEGSFGANSIFDRAANFLLLPLAGIVGMAPYDFPGFTGHVTNFYTVTGPLAAVGELVFVLATTLFWVAWVNLNIGLFNCIPVLPLDGGRLVHAATGEVRDRWFPDRESLPETVTLAATGLVVLSLAVTLALPVVA